MRSLRPSFLTTTFSTMTAISNKPPSVNVEITSDLMCPWCWVGLRKLQAASRETGIDTTIMWKPYMLRPNIPNEGTPKTGTPASRVGSHLRAAGESVGIDFTGLTDRTPNTSLFHATMKMLQETLPVPNTSATSFQESVFEGYFTLGVYPDQDGLLQAARNMKDEDGKDEVCQAVEALYKNEARLEEYREAIKYEAIQASAGGVSGVPSFEFNGRPAFSGAQPVSTFAGYLKRALKQEV